MDATLIPAGFNTPPLALFGRAVLYTSEKEITSSNVLKVLNKTLPTFNQNAMESNYLYLYYRGYQPILERIKEIRPEINNKIVENHANEIVSFKTGYLFGSPIQYCRRAAKKDTAQEEENKNITDDIVF